ncbi:hypothetical protein MRX96_022267 [Rhipicephalus microplus]
MLSSPVLDLSPVLESKSSTSATGRRIVSLDPSAFALQPSENRQWTRQFLASVIPPFPKFRAYTDAPENPYRRLGSCEARESELKSEDAVLWLFPVFPGRFRDHFDLAPLGPKALNS